MEDRPEGQQDHREYANRYEDFSRQYHDYGERIRESVEQNIGQRMRQRAERRMAREQQRACSGPPGGGIVIGALIILAGVVLLLDNFGIIEIRNFWQFWPVILIAVGVSKLLEARGRGSGLVLGTVLIVLGTVWTLDNVGIIVFDPRLMWPLIIIGIGALLLFRSLDRRRLVIEPSAQPADSPAFQPKAASSGDTVQQWAIFGGGKRVIDSQNFRGGQAFAMFGGIELDLRNAALPRTALIDASVVFGGIEVRVPPTWLVEVRGSGVFGGYEDKTLHPRVERPDEAPRLIVTGAAVFGGVGIKN